MPATSTLVSPRQKLTALALACERHGISDRAAATIASAVLQDIGIVTETNRSSVIDRNKVRQERHRKRIELQACQTSKVLRAFILMGEKIKR